MTQTPELKACPFCGGRGVGITYVRDGWQATCGCGASGKPCFHGPLDQPSSEERAIAAWNTRPLEADNAALKAKNEALVEALAKRDAKADACPIDKPHCSDADRAKCSRCGATASEGCHVKAMADYTFTQEARAALAGAQ